MKWNSGFNVMIKRRNSPILLYCLYYKNDNDMIINKQVYQESWKKKKQVFDFIVYVKSLCKLVIC